MKKAKTKAPRKKPAKPAGPSRARNYPVVGFGASAGGVEAFTQLLNALSPDAGMAYVLVQHLDSRHSSVLTEILGRATRMPVQWARQGMRVEPNHVYVIPPNTDLEIFQGKLQVKPRSTIRGIHLPIDHFLRSLAEDRGSMAVGVILSGTASDGTLGLKAIKAEGGITFAQSEGSSKYSSMPSSAISAGFVDYILAPDAIARELASIGKHPFLHLKESAVAIVPTQGDDEMGKLFSMLRSKTGVDFTHYKQTTIRRRIARRMVVRKIERFSEYLHYIRQHPAELEALYQDILISVTSFFRDATLFRALKNSVFPKLLRKRSTDDPVRIWVPGCATGEEAYSIAIVLSEYLREEALTTPIQIFATDIAGAAVERARNGVYPETIAADVPPELLRRYFSSADSSYQVTRTLRDMCVFARQNLVRDPPFSRLDLISCRNVLIYLAPILQRRAMNVFHYALKPGGYLVLGSSETVGTPSDLFTLLDKKNKIYSKKAGPSRLAMDFATEPASWVEPSKSAPRPWSPADAAHEADRILINRYAPPGVVVNEAMKVIQFRGRTGRFLEPGPGEPNLNLFRMAREGLVAVLRTTIQGAQKKEGPARSEDVQVRYNGGFLNVAVEVTPFSRSGSKERFFLILFEESPQPAPGKRKAAAKPKTGGHQVYRLEQELAAAKQYLQSIIETQEASNEELKSANEEIQSSNEELQSTNEEMETAKEELQSANEELTTVNEELATRNTELAQVNNDLNNLLVSVQLPLVMVDSELRLRRFTPTAEKLLNLIPTDVGRPLLDIRPNIDLPDLQETLRGVIDNLRVVEREVQDRAGRAYSMWVRPYRTAENKIDGVVLAFVDVSALKRSLEQTRDLREYAEAIASTVREPFLALDESLCVITANAPFYAMFALTPDKVENRPFFEIGNGEWDIPQVRSALTDPKGSFVQGLEVERIFIPTGRRSLSINMRRIPAGGPTRMVLIAIEDISLRQALRDAQASFSAFSRDAPVGIVQTDRRGNCADINPEACRIAGVDRKDALGRGWTRHIHADDLPVFLAKEREIRETREGFSAELRFVLHSNRITWTHAVLVPLSGSDRAFHGYLAALTDVSQHKDLEERLAQALKMEAVGRLAGGVAHDFNNMLTAISSYAAQLLQTLPQNHRAHRAAVQINSVVDQAAMVTRQLLAFSRKQILRPTCVDLNEVLREMYDLLARLLGDTIEISLEPSPEKETVLLDVGQLQQVILNVAINARDAMSDGGRLTLSTSHFVIDAAEQQRDGLNPGEYVVLSVSDTGIGMDRETLERVFEPFFTTKPPGSGTGLGLSMVYGIIQQSGGSIKVESEPGKGTRLRIYLPRRGSAPETVPAPVHVGKDGGDETVLLVEDAAVVRNLVRELLEERGYTVLEARDSHEALNIAGNHDGQIDLLLTDLVMPRMGGHQLAKRLQRSRKDLRVIFMSGYSGDALHAVEKEANFLEKPFKPEALAAFVRRVLDAPRK